MAIEGCGHGELDKIYETLQYLEQKEGKKVDLLICCGDFQARGGGSAGHWAAAAMCARHAVLAPPPPLPPTPPPSRCAAGRAQPG